MISVTEEISLLTKQENQLHTSLDNLRGQRSKVKEHKQLEKELAGVLRKRQNLQAYEVFELGMPVHRISSSRLGIVKELKITPGGMGEVWVSWEGLLQIPEQPNLLQIDDAARAKIIAVGDRIKIVDGHERAGKTFTVARLLARGAVETTEQQIFEREEWQKIVEATQKLVQNSIHSSSFSQETQMVTQLIEELGGETLETTVTVNTTATQIEELTDDEEKERHWLELKVEQAFYEAGTSLRELRDKRLYRSTHTTFETYCRDRFGFTRANATYLITGASVVDNLKKMSTNGLQILPTNERQTRPLTKLEPNEQRQVWQQAVEQADGKVPSGRIVKGIVDRLKEKPLVKARDFCTVGDAFILTRLEGTERKYNGCWVIASQLRDFTVVVDVYDGELAVKPENLNPIDLPDVRRQLPETLKRIKRLRNNVEMLDRGASNILKDLGRQIYLTEFEADLLTFMEQRYGIDN
jgi:signal recognition particle GTPase